ncbi:hypothetical protein GCM10009830_20610 [Glycomyces endophyticus]|uniref:Protein kinase domain-containing protein n=1 Tax=Glycomyces endophyticus TaxID=480996 RepID=A0ABP4SR88_9ACTN
MTHHDRPSSLDDLGELTVIGDGGQGVVKRTSRMPGVLYKQYHAREQLNVVELERLIRLVHTDMRPGPDRNLILSSAAWPSGVVLDGGVHCGLTMPEAPDHFTADIGEARKLRELQFLIFRKKAGWSNLRLPDETQRRALLLRYARLFKALHAIDVIIGDVSPRNLLWTIEPEPAVYMLDCDGCRIAGHLPPMPQAQTPDWADPDQEVGTATFDSDRFKLALLILRVLLVEPKITPVQVAANSEQLGRLGGPVAELAVRVADGERCRAEEWIGALENRPTLTFAPIQPPAPKPGPRREGPERPMIPFVSAPRRPPSRST